MSEIRTQPVKAIRVPVVNSESPPGAFKYYHSGASIYQKWADADGKKPTGLIYVCPCGCGMVSWLEFKPEESPSWEWDGNLDEPTLSPSVWYKGHWHGWLQGGIWRSV